MPAPLLIKGEFDVAGFKSHTVYMRGHSRFMKGPVATVFEDPSIDASDIEINRTGSQELVIWGAGFNDMVPPAIQFDPPLDSANLHIDVRGFKHGCQSANLRVFCKKLLRLL